MKNKQFTSHAQVPTFRMAAVPKQFDSIRIVVGSEENIFNETFVTGLLTNNRVVKFKKETLVFE
jgi:hypothetical protein